MVILPGTRFRLYHDTINAGDDDYVITAVDYETDRVTVLMHGQRDGWWGSFDTRSFSRMRDYTRTGWRRIRALNLSTWRRRNGSRPF